MGDQTKRLSTREKQALEPFVRDAEDLSRRARNMWTRVGQILDEFGSKNHSQCCPIGGMTTGAQNGFEGTTPCPCGWDSPESVEDVLRRMIAHVGTRLGNPTDVETSDLLTDALAALGRAKT